MKRLAYSDNSRIADELELAENLRNARMLLSRLGSHRRILEPDSYAETHLRTTGHQLRFGCCRDAALEGRPTEDFRDHR